MSLSRSTRKENKDALREDEPKHFDTARFFTSLKGAYWIRYDLHKPILKDNKPEDRPKLKK